MSNYPPGVTGNEWALRGPEEEQSVEYCEECDEDVETVRMYSGSPNSSGPATHGSWRCPTCDAEYECDVPNPEDKHDHYIPEEHNQI